jgi:ComF family protein
MEKIRQGAKYLKSAADMVLPPICPITGYLVDSPGQVHESYWQTLSFISAPFCSLCGVPHSTSKNEDKAINKELRCPQCLDKAPEYDTHRAALKYDDASKMLVLKFKHQDHGHLIKTFTPWLSALAGELTAIDYVLPVPLHYRRLLYRRYNQSALLAKDLSQRLDIPYRGDILKRVRATASQGHKSPKERIKNVKGAFAVNDTYLAAIKGKNLLLIDDVYTTGATLNACALALKKSGAAQVHCLSIARALKD